MGIDAHRTGEEAHEARFARRRSWPKRQHSAKRVQRKRWRKLRTATGKALYAAASTS